MQFIDIAHELAVYADLKRVIPIQGRGYWITTENMKDWYRISRQSVYKMIIEMMENDLEKFDATMLTQHGVREIEWLARHVVEIEDKRGNFV